MLLKVTQYTETASPLTDIPDLPTKNHVVKHTLSLDTRLVQWDWFPFLDSLKIPVILSDAPEDIGSCPSQGSGLLDS